MRACKSRAALNLISMKPALTRVATMHSDLMVGAASPQSRGVAATATASSTVRKNRLRARLLSIVRGSSSDCERIDIKSTLESCEGGRLPGGLFEQPLLPPRRGLCRR